MQPRIDADRTAPPRDRILPFPGGGVHVSEVVWDEVHAIELARAQRSLIHNEPFRPITRTDALRLNIIADAALVYLHIITANARAK